MHLVSMTKLLRKLLIKRIDIHFHNEISRKRWSLSMIPIMIFSLKAEDEELSVKCKYQWGNILPGRFIREYNFWGGKDKLWGSHGSHRLWIPQKLIRSTFILSKTQQNRTRSYIDYFYENRLRKSGRGSLIRIWKRTKRDSKMKRNMAPFSRAKWRKYIPGNPLWLPSDSGGFCAKQLELNLKVESIWKKF